MATETLKSKTAKGVFWSSASNLLSQVINMLFGLVLARILTPEDYGIVGLLTVFAGLASALQECGLSSALINKKDASQKDYDTVFWFTAGSSVVLYVILFFCTPLIADFYCTGNTVSVTQYLYSPGRDTPFFSGLRYR